MSYTLLSESTPKARKSHRCIWCGEMIIVGETYRRENSVYDGHMHDHAWHLECDGDAKSYFIESGEEDFSPGEANRPEVRLGFVRSERIANDNDQSE